MDMNSNDIIIIIRKNNLKTKLEASTFSRTGKTKHAAVDPRSRRAKGGVFKMVSTLEYWYCRIPFQGAQGTSCLCSICKEL